MTTLHCAFVNSWQLAGFFLFVLGGQVQHSNSTTQYHAIAASKSGQPNREGEGKADGGTQSGRFNNYKFQQTAAVAGGAEGTRQEGTGLVFLLTSRNIYYFYFILLFAFWLQKCDGRGSSLRIRGVACAARSRRGETLKGGRYSGRAPSLSFCLTAVHCAVLGPPRGLPSPATRHFGGGDVHKRRKV